MTWTFGVGGNRLLGRVLDLTFVNPPLFADKLADVPLHITLDLRPND